MINKGKLQMAASDISPQSGYIQHHLVHLNNTGEKQDVLADFSVINYDSVFWSLLTGIITLYFLYRAARRATPAVPGRFQMDVEVLVEWVARGRVCGRGVELCG